MAYSKWLPKQTLHELREIKRCAALAARGMSYTFQQYGHKQKTDPIAHVSSDSLDKLKAAISELLVRDAALISGLLSAHCGSVALELVRALPECKAPEYQS